MIHNWLQLVSVCLLLLGVVLSIAGTYFLTHLYHSFQTGDLFASAWRAVWQMVCFQHETLQAEANIAAELGTVDPERRGKSLIGIYLIFLGFVLQGVGTVLALLDTVLGWGAKPC